MGRLGIGLWELRKDNPGLIYCSIAGFAADGPNVRRPAFDTIGQALSGMLHLFADPEQPRMRGPTVSDQVPRLYAANPLLRELVERGRTSIGQRHDVAIIGSSNTSNPHSLPLH